MQVTVNGQSMELDDGATVRQVIERLGLAKAACAAEVNKKLVPRRDQESCTLANGDTVEVVSLVGGG
ncbi:MAG: sulfur carrier protein ThiS [Phycisphaerales bacterium]|jgi:thiamine biosynthesis protein ThiS